MRILGVDIGTTGLKMGVFDSAQDDVVLIKQHSEFYAINTYNNGLYGDIDPNKWLQAFHNGCEALKEDIVNVDVISLSGTTPGLTAMDENGIALSPAILMLDQRSRRQAQYIIDKVGVDYLLENSGNMPVAGGCSLASILWIKEKLPDVYEKTFKFGHSNTFIGCWLTGSFAMDPSSASLSALYNTAKNDLTWNAEIADSCDFSLEKMPDLLHASDNIGTVKQELCAQLGFAQAPDVLIGGNDAVLAAYSAGIRKPGETINVNGTCEISLVCLPKCIPSKNYNVRAHVLPNRWLTLHVVNAGGKAYEWFKNVFCNDMTDDEFYAKFIEQALERWLEKETRLKFLPYLMGSRYSQDSLKAKFDNLTIETTREELLAALTKGLCENQRLHLQEIDQLISIRSPIKVTGGAVNDAILRAKKKWYWNTDYLPVDQSSLRGAALLALTLNES